MDDNNVFFVAGAICRHLDCALDQSKVIAAARYIAAHFAAQAQPPATPNVGAAAQARRIYMHVLNGGFATATDIARMVETIERLEAVQAQPPVNTESEDQPFRRIEEEGLRHAEQKWLAGEMCAQPPVSQPVSDDLPPFPRVQVPRIDADIDLMDVNRLAKWCERTSKEYARAALAQQASGHDGLSAALASIRQSVIDMGGGPSGVILVKHVLGYIDSARAAAKESSND